jgi:hypothetical protein
LIKVSALSVDETSGHAVVANTGEGRVELIVYDAALKATSWQDFPAREGVYALEFFGGYVVAGKALCTEDPCQNVVRSMSIFKVGTPRAWGRLAHREETAIGLAMEVPIELVGSREPVRDAVCWRVGREPGQTMKAPGIHRVTMRFM